MISKRELSRKRDVDKVASAYDALKDRHDKMLEALEWYWISVEIDILQDTFIDENFDIIPGKEKPFKDFSRLYICAWDNFERLSEKIRKEMEGE